jgi:hypothetical protein
MRPLHNYIKPAIMSYRRRPVSSIINIFWMPAYAGMTEPVPDPDPGFTGMTTFDEVVNVEGA